MVGQRPIPVNVKRLTSLWSPFERLVWDELETPITIEEVRHAIKEGNLQSPEQSFYKEEIKCTRKTHVERIAWLVENDWAQPIQLDVGSPSMGYTPMSKVNVLDGNHRLAAAIVRGDDYIYAWVDGSVSRIHDLFSRKKAS